MFEFIKKSEIADLREEAEKSKLIKGFKKHVQEMASEGRFRTDIIAAMRAAGVKKFDQSFVEYLHEKGFTCADTFEEMDEKEGNITWDTAEKGLAHDMQILANAYIKQCLDNLKVNIESAINSDPYISKFSIQESRLIPGARKILRDMGYVIKKANRTVNGYPVYEIEL